MDYRGCLFKFPPFTLDADARVLLRDGWPLRLQPKTVDVLLALIEKQGNVVSARDLMNVVWGQTAVEPGNLTRHISELRRALGDEDEEYIRTVHRRGYKFVAPVSIVKLAEVAAGD
jgi:DNA-binding winged helix-turn-helix (wHTH) protein